MHRYILLFLLMFLSWPVRADPLTRPMDSDHALIGVPHRIDRPLNSPVYPYNNGFSYIIPYAPALSCWPGSILICGMIIPISSQLPVGASMTLALPSPLKHQTFTVTCLAQTAWSVIRSLIKAR